MTETMINTLRRVLFCALGLTLAAGCASTTGLSTKPRSESKYPSTQIEKITGSKQALAVVDKAISNTYRDSQFTVFSFHNTIEKLDIRAKRYSKKPTTYQERHGRFHSRGPSLGEEIIAAFPWKDITEVETTTLGGRTGRQKRIKSVILKFKRLDQDENTIEDEITLNILRGDNIVDLFRSPIVNPADLLLAIQILRGKHVPAEGPNNEPASIRGAEDLETKLKRLKSLLDQGLISPDLYREKQQQLLDTL